MEIIQNKENFAMNLDLLASVALRLETESPTKILANPTFYPIMPKKSELIEADNQPIDLSSSRNSIFNSDSTSSEEPIDLSMNSHVMPAKLRSKMTKSTKSIKSRIPIATRLATEPKILTATKPKNQDDLSSIQITTKPTKVKSENAEDQKIVIKTPEATSFFGSMRKRKAASKTPDELKDEEYYVKRQKNNEAARKSREAKNLAAELARRKLEILEEENTELMTDYNEQLEQLISFRIMADNCPELKQHLEKSLKKHPDLVIMKSIMEMPSI